MTEKQCILLVDDDRDMQRLLNSTLQHEGFDTVIVADGQAALHLMDKIKPVLVILDEMTAAEDGLQVVENIRELSEVPIIVLAREYQMETLRQVLSRGADDYIRKPFDTRSFVARVRAKLRRAGQATART
jgi:two-component system response regulator ResD